MYSVVMMMALTVNADVPEFGHRGGCCGGYSSCYGCCGYSYGCCGGCYGYSSCYGCCGGYTYSSCSGCCGYSYGCCGGCSGYSSCYGCTGVSYGCCGGCTGISYGCCGGCTGVSYGCCGGCTGISSGCCGGCTGISYGCGGCGGVITGAAYAPVTTGYVAAPTATPPVAAQDSKTSARLVVTLPAEAKLTIDGEATTSTSTTRVFVTPALEAGKTYKYTLTATVVVGDKNEVITKEVNVVAGQETRATLSLPEAVASAGK
jgi:uncharacterized protein (TIGR03000 family)